jgi:hypothetical protein
MIETLHFLWLAFSTYRAAKKGGGLCYRAWANSHGVPVVAVFIGVGREAWRVSQRAIEDHQVRT